MTNDRRQVVSGLAAAIVAVTANATSGWAKAFVPPSGPRIRVLFVNDLSGDIDGLFAAVHAIYSPSIDLRGIVATTTGRPKETTKAAADIAHEMLRLTGRADQIKVFEGAERKLSAAGVPIRSAGTQAIIDEALRTDTKLPLMVTVGGGLTEIASALMIEPGIASKLTLIWIGGDPYPKGGSEYNFNIDPIAAQHVFNETEVPIWQVTSGVYASCAVSDTEIQAYVSPSGAIGAWLYTKLSEAAATLGQYKLNPGETYTLGDSPLVLLTALTDWVPSSFSPSFRYERTGSSKFDEIFAPRLLSDGTYQVRTEGRKIRVYTAVDTRMMFNDFYAKLRVNAAN